MEIVIRPVEDKDYVSIARIVNLIEAPWQTNERECRKEDADIERCGGALRHYVATESLSGEVIGHAVLRGGKPESERQTYHLEIRVDLAVATSGIGTLLWRRIEAELSHLPHTSVRAWIRDCYPYALEFARSQGFAEIHRSGPWRLTISDLNMAPIQAHKERPRASGVTIASLTHEMTSGVRLEELHQLRVAVDRDIPAVEPYEPIGFESFVSEIESDSSLKDAVFIAKHKNKCVGLTCLHRNPTDPQTLNQSTTGVLRDWRRCGIAMALKAYGAEYAATNGYQQIDTYVDSANAPMAALNLKIGFKPGVLVVLMERSAREEVD